jgi:hypothetical protein
MSRVRFHSIEAIARYPGIELIKSGLGWEDFIDCKQIQLKYNPDLIIWYKPLEMTGYERVTVPTCLRYNEMWDVKHTTNEILTSKSKLIICHHENDIKNYSHIEGVKFYHNVQCAERKIFKDYGLNKDFDVQVIGAIRPLIYPLRSRLNELIETQIVPKYNVKYRLLTHPGYIINNVDNQVVNYAHQLNRAKINITCSSKFNYALAKYSEVPLCKSLLLADMPGENQDWYKKWMVLLENDFSDKRIVELIVSLLKDNKSYEEKVTIGYEENIKNRTQENYAKKFMKIVCDFLR